MTKEQMGQAVQTAKAVLVGMVLVAAVAAAAWFWPGGLYSRSPTTLTLLKATSAAAILGAVVAWLTRICRVCGQRTTLRFLVAVFVVVSIAVVVFRLSQQRSDHSFRIVGRCTDMSVAASGRWTPIDLSQPSDSGYACKLAMFRVEKGKAFVYWGARETPVQFDLPTALRVVGSFRVAFDSQNPVRHVTIAGITRSIWVSDFAEESPPPEQRPRYGREITPTDLEERRDVLLLLGALVGLTYGVVQILLALQRLRGDSKASL